MNEHSWIEISRSALLNNYRLFRERAGGAKLMPVLKANAYGHGLVGTARALAR